MMEDRKIQSRKRYLLAFLIGTVLFILIFFLSYSLSYFEYQRVSNLQESIAYSIFEDKLDYSFFNKQICSNESFKIMKSLIFIIFTPYSFALKNFFPVFGK